MEKKYHFITGLPRSGSTLLANILAQNPRFHATSTSGVPNLILHIRNVWDKIPELMASPNKGAKKRVMKAILEAYHADIEKPVIFDKSRTWVSMIEIMEYLLDEKVKMIITVRDVRDIFASLELLWRKNMLTKQIPQEGKEYIKFQTIRGRCGVWFSPDQPVGVAYNRVLDAFKRGLSDRMYIVDFDNLTTRPNEVMSDIYRFLGEEKFEHNFDSVEQKTKEDDTFHGIDGLHDIRSKVEPIKSRWKEVLGPEFESYGKLNFWKDNKSLSDKKSSII